MLHFFATPPQSTSEQARSRFAEVYYFPSMQLSNITRAQIPSLAGVNENTRMSSKIPRTGTDLNTNDLLIVLGETIFKLLIQT